MKTNNTNNIFNTNKIIEHPINKKSIKLKLYSILGFLLLFVMILFPSLALEGAKQGLTLWFQNLLPALFPYTILSSYILGLNNEKTPAPRYFAMFTGLLCGYPLGAKITAQLVRGGKLSIREGQYLIGFCNLASPSFLIQYVTAQSLGSMNHLPAVLFSVYGSAILTGLITYPMYIIKSNVINCNTRKHCALMNQREMKTSNKMLTMQSKQVNMTSTTLSYTINDAIMESFEAMVRLGGYLVLFSIIAKMVTALFTTVTTSHFFLIGVIEITNGVHFISEGNLPDTTKLLLLAFCVSFGGFSCFAQSAGMCQNSGLSMPKYFITKLMNGCIAFALMYLWCRFYL